MKPYPSQKRWPLLILAAIVLITAHYFPQTENTRLSQDSLAETINVNAQHILYGDHKGGGHKFGIGKPCKSEFPQGWSDKKIVTTTKNIAANNNLKWKKQNNGYFVSEQKIEGVKVRVVLSRDKDYVVTAYPVNLPRNPCPANDNDYSVRKL